MIYVCRAEEQRQQNAAIVLLSSSERTNHNLRRHNQLKPTTCLSLFMLNNTLNTADVIFSSSWSTVWTLLIKQCGVCVQEEDGVWAVWAVRLLELPIIHALTRVCVCVCGHTHMHETKQEMRHGFCRCQIDWENKRYDSSLLEMCECAQR